MHKSVLLTLSLAIIFISLETIQAEKDCPKEATCPNACHAPDFARYDYYRMYQVELSNQLHVDLFHTIEVKSDSVVFYGHSRTPKQKLIVLVAAHKIADFVDLLKTYHVRYRILSYNFQEKIDRNFGDVMPACTDPKNFDWDHYYRIDTIYAWMAHMVTKYPKDLKLLDIGPSTMGLPIIGIKLARNTTNKAIFIESGIHAREWIAPATATFLINTLLTSTDPEVQCLADNYNWIFFPIVNPDGYKYSFDGDRMWRKNRRAFCICRGVDLNRNFPSQWNTTGASSDPCRFDYAGPEVASEVETKCLISYLLRNVEKERIRTYLSLHAYSQLIMFPHGYTSRNVGNYNDMYDIGKKAVKQIKQLTGRTYKFGSSYHTIYPSSGTSKDWVHDYLNIPMAFTFELRGPPDSEDMFILPASEIVPTAMEAFAAIKIIVNEAEKKGYYN